MRGNFRIAAFLIIIVLHGGNDLSFGQPLVIQPGQDGFVTTPVSTFRLPGLPAGFFGTVAGIPSDATLPQDITVVSGPNLVALPVITTFLAGPGCHPGQTIPGNHCYEQQLVTLVPTYDTVVQRGGGSIPTIGASLPVPVELVHLSLESAAPIQVFYGPASRFFDIYVELDGPQVQGTLTLNRTMQNGGEMDTILPVEYQITFDEVGGPMLFQMGGLQNTMASQGNDWQVLVAGSIPTISQWGQLVLLLLTLLAGTLAFGFRRRNLPVRA